MAVKVLDEGKSLFPYITVCDKCGSKLEIGLASDVKFLDPQLGMGEVPQVYCPCCGRWTNLPKELSRQIKVEQGVEDLAKHT
jgi:hypothetical protein